MDFVEIISSYLGYAIAAVSLLFILLLGVSKVRHMLGVTAKGEGEGSFMDNFS